MGIFQSKTNEDVEQLKSDVEKNAPYIKLEGNAPEYAGKLSSGLLYFLCRLMEEYQYEFCYGLNGMNDPSVELFGPDQLLMELVEKLPYEYVMEKGAIAKKKKRIYSDVSQLNRYIWSLDRDQCLEFFPSSKTSNQVWIVFGCIWRGGNAEN